MLRDCHDKRYATRHDDAAMHVAWREIHATRGAICAMMSAGVALMRYVYVVVDGARVSRQRHMPQARQRARFVAVTPVDGRRRCAR